MSKIFFRLLKPIFYVLLLTFNLQAQDLSIEVGKMILPTNTGESNPYITKSNFCSNFIQIDYLIRKSKPIGYVFGLQLSNPKMGLRHAKEYAMYLEEQTFEGGYAVTISGGVVHNCFFNKKRIQIFPQLLLNTSVSTGGVAGLNFSILTDDLQLGGRYLNDGYVNLMLNPKIRIQIPMGKTLRFLVNIGYQQSFGKIGTVEYYIYENSGPEKFGPYYGYARGSNFNYSLGFSISPTRKK